MSSRLREHWPLLGLALVPGAAGFAAAAACPMRKDDGAPIPFRPPGWFFGAAWPVLYLAFGTAWALAALSRAPRWGEVAGVSVPYLVATALLTAWIPVRAPVCRVGPAAAHPPDAAEERRKRKHSFWILLGAASAVAFCVALEWQPAASRLLSLLLLCWLCVATLMSMWEFGGGGGGTPPQPPR